MRKITEYIREVETNQNGKVQKYSQSTESSKINHVQTSNAGTK